MSAHISNIWYVILVMLPIVGSIGIFFIPFKKRSYMCIYTEVLTVATSILSFVIMTHRPRNPIDIVTFVSKFSITLGYDGMGSIFGGLI